MGTVQHHDSHVISAFNLPHALQWYVPSPWHPLLWPHRARQDTPVLISTTSLRAQTTQKPTTPAQVNPLYGSMWLRQKACVNFQNKGLKPLNHLILICYWLDNCYSSIEFSILWRSLIKAWVGTAVTPDIWDRNGTCQPVFVQMLFSCKSL